MLVRAYGLYWNPDVVDWGRRGPGNSGSLQGWFKYRRRTISVDVWEQRGVYVLHHDFKSIYVGKADSVSLGARLKGHLGDRLAGRWDMFSWYGVRTVLVGGGLGTFEQRIVKHSDIVATLEAFGIAAVDPPLNRRREAIPGARNIEQAGVDHPRTTREYLKRILGLLDENGEGEDDAAEDE